MLPFNWVIEWDRFDDHASDNPEHFARKIDTRLVGPLHDMINQGDIGRRTDPDRIQQLLKDLAMRNLCGATCSPCPPGRPSRRRWASSRSPTPSSPSGDPGHRRRRSTDGGFLDATPLWFYVLKEAEVHANGNTLGEVGSRIVAETIIGQLYEDPNSYVNHDWTPAEGVRMTDGSDGHHLVVTDPRLPPGRRRPLIRRRTAGRRGVRCLAPGPHVRCPLGRA